MDVHSFVRYMCGVGGILSFCSQNVTLSSLKSLSGLISHRGPDDSGVFLSDDRKVGFIHRRLSIIDLTKSAHQPMSYLRSRFWITFNGEIYNFQEQQKRLQKMGYKFHSRSDTEVILALYSKYGVECLKFLRGMFSFAIYDVQKNTVFIARDRLGKKPLKYYYDANFFIFSSELKGMLKNPNIHMTPDWLAINNYLTYGYVPAPLTGFENIQKLAPGNYLFIDLNNNTVEKKEYWKPDYSQKYDLSESEWENKILDKLEEAVKIRMISDVPIGALLSGGVDSSSVVAMMSKLSVKPVKTFTICYNEGRYDESRYAKQVSDIFKTDHEILTADTSDVTQMVNDLVYQYEEPYANSSSVVAYQVSKLARKKVTVVLNGDGGDENFADYDRHIRFCRDANFNKLKPYIPNFLYDSVDNICMKSHSKNVLKINKYIQKMRGNMSQVFVNYKCFYKNEEKLQLYNNYLRGITKNLDSCDYYEDKFTNSGTKDIRDQALFADMTSYLPDDLLTKIDIASMAYGLEARSPILDHELVELACHIPYELKVKNGEGKYIFKKALEKILPKEILYRQKMGFSIPLQEWYMGDLKKYTAKILLSSGSIATKYFDSKYIKHLINSHSVNTDNSHKLWSLLILDLWFNKFIYD